MQSSFIMHGARPQAGARPLSTGSARQLLAPPCGQRGYHRSAAISPTRASANRQRLHVSAASAEKMTVRQARKLPNAIRPVSTFARLGAHTHFLWICR